MEKSNMKGITDVRLDGTCGPDYQSSRCRCKNDRCCGKGNHIPSFFEEINIKKDRSP